MTIDWQAVAQRLGFPDEVAMWQKFYVERRFSIDMLSVNFQVSRSTIRTSLRRCGIALRKRGQPVYDLTFLSALALRVARDGIATVAEEEGCTRNTIYVRLRTLKKASKS